MALVVGRLTDPFSSQGHHADIGGILAGSMPPTVRHYYHSCQLRRSTHLRVPLQSTALYQEGAQIRSFFLVKDGTFDRDGLYKIMVEDPAEYEGCSGCRAFGDVESDLKAQIAANHKGSQLIAKLIKEYGLPTVHAYMVSISRLKSISSGTNLTLLSVCACRGLFAITLSLEFELSLSEPRLSTETFFRRSTTWTTAVRFVRSSCLPLVRLANPARSLHTQIALDITIDPEEGSAVFDFEGQSPFEDRVQRDPR